MTVAERQGQSDETEALVCGIPGTSTAMVAAAAEVLRERVRQHAKWGEQNHPDGTGPYALPDLLAEGHHRYALGLARWAKARTDAAAERGDVTYAHILTEEWAEAMVETDPDRLRAELVQVAAVAMQWIELLNRRLARPGEASS